MRETTSRIYKTACADGRGLALAGMYPVLNPSGYILAAHNKKGSIMKKRQTPADAAADIKRQAARAATRKIQGTESIGGGYTITGGSEIDLTQCAQTIKNTYAEKMAFFNALSGIQRTWTKQYIEGAILDYYYPSKYIRALCPVLISVVDAIESGELKPDFSKAALLQWANGEGLTLTPEGLAAWEGLNTNKQANAELEKPQANTKAGGGLAAAIGARAWRDIRLVVRTGGVTFHGTKSYRVYPWDKIEFGGNAIEQKAFLITIAAAGGFLAHPGHEQEMKRIGTSDIDGLKMEQQERKREIDSRILKQYYHNYADEKARNRIYAMTTRLNRKFMALFPDFTGKPFENKNRVTYCYLKEIKFQK